MILWGVSFDTLNRCVLAAVEKSGVPYQDGMGAVGGWQFIT